MEISVADSHKIIYGEGVSLSIRQSLRYPFASPHTQRRFWVIVLLALIPSLGSLLMGPFATAAVSVMTMEQDEQAPLSVETLLARSLRALLAGWVTVLYLFPALLGLSIIGLSVFHGGNITWPVVLLVIYGLMVASALPWAVLHAVTTRHVWNALHLPQLIWIGFKVDFVTFVKVLLLSALLVTLKLTAGFFSFVGVSFLLAPVNAYVEYVFQYLLAKHYVAAFPAKVTG